MCLRVYSKELILIIMMDYLANEFLDLLAIQVLERREVAYMKRLEKMRFMCGHAEHDYFV